jgi:[ribosomal protein S5]-alanine N-acetyltransferase
MPLPLLTERLLIRAFEPDDLPALHAVYGDPEVTRWIPPYPTLEHTRRALDLHVRGARGGGPAFWAVIERSSGDLIGDAGLAPIEGGPEIELGYTLGRRWWGRGYATEAARACLDEAFGPLGIERVVALIRPGNHASIRVAEKLGLRREGRRVAHGGAEHLVYAASGSGPASEGTSSGSR